MTLTEIAEKAGCTYDEVVEAILNESDSNKKIYEAGRKETEAQRKKIEAEFKTLESENKKLTLLIENSKLLAEWTAISIEMEAKRKRRDTEKTPPPLNLAKP